MISQGEIWWADLDEPTGSGPGYRRPVVVVQGDDFNRSRISTVVVVPLTANLKWAHAPGTVVLQPGDTGLDKDSVANVSLIAAIDRSLLLDRVGHVPRVMLERVLAGVERVLGRPPRTR